MQITRRSIFSFLAAALPGPKAVPAQAIETKPHFAGQGVVWSEDATCFAMTCVQYLTVGASLEHDVINDEPVDDDD